MFTSITIIIILFAHHMVGERDSFNVTLSNLFLTQENILVKEGLSFVCWFLATLGLSSHLVLSGF